MKTYLSCVLALSCICSAALGFDIVRDGKPAAVIVTPAADGQAEEIHKWTVMAAEWVRDYVKQATGAELEIVSEPDVPQGNIISVGHTKLAADAGIGTDDLKWDGCRMIVKGKTLYLIGRDQVGPAKRDFIGAKGTNVAAAKFLEEFLGVRWFIPSPEGTFVPETKDFIVPDDLAKTITPVFAYAHGRYLYGIRTPAAYANNWRTAVKAYTAGGHTWPVWVPYTKYFDDHPEYFALIGNARVGNKWNHLCTTNDEVKRILLREIRKKFDEGYDWAQLAQSDGYRRCQCERCEALDNYRGWKMRGPDAEKFFYVTLRNNPCERILLLHKAIIDECRKSHPDKKVHLLVYGPTSWPSRKFDRFGDNVVAEVCPRYEDTLPVWKEKVYACTVYVYFWGTYHSTGIGPKYTPKQVADSIRLFRDNNVIGVYYCGGGEDWGLEGPAYYTAAKLMADPDLDYHEVTAEYCKLAFGKAAGTMAAFFDKLYERTLYDRKVIQRARPLNNPQTVFPMLYPPEVLKILERLLDKAERQADTERSKGWINLTRIYFDHIKLTSRMFTFYRAYLANETRANLLQLRKAVEDWKAFRQMLLDYDRKKAAVWFPGLGAVQRHIKEGGHLHSTIRAPVTWDFDQMEKALSRKKPEAGSLTAPRAPQPPAIDGAIGEAEWKKAPPTEIRGIEGGAAPVDTRLRVMYDDKNLYVAYECGEPEIDAIRASKKARDGDIWNLDCVELFLDPAASRARYQHFIAAPAEGAFLDGRVGFITDPLDPFVNRLDTRWNPDWKYAFKIDTAGKKWTLEMCIPFASLGVEPPRPGTVWLGNFGRERYADGGKGRNPDLSLWSPNPLGTGFCEPICFGEIKFTE